MSKSYDSKQLRENQLLSETYNAMMEAYLVQADTASVDDDRQRLVAAISRQTLRTFVEELLRHSEMK